MALMRGVAGRVPVPALFGLSGFTQYYGAALAVNLFAVIPALGVAWWRILFSAVVLLCWQRPWRSRWSRRDLLTAIGFGLVLAAMNLCFYVAIAHLPLGNAVAIEFLGPVAVAAVTGRSWRERAGIVLALAGVVALAGVSASGGFTTGTATGLIAILGSAVFWAGYILLGRRVASRRDGLAGLTVGMTAGAIVFCPLAFGSMGAVITAPGHLAALAGIAVLSSVIPYAIEQLVLRRVSAARFAILLALLPVAALVMGLLVLHQIPTWLELVGVAAVCAAIAVSAPRETEGSAGELGG